MKTLYEVLTVLDTKGLVAFDGIIVDATTLAAEKGGAFQKRGMTRQLAVFTIVLALIGSVACLFVSEISYPFAGMFSLYLMVDLLGVPVYLTLQHCAVSM